MANDNEEKQQMELDRANKVMLITCSFLHDFISQGFPSPDPVKQVELAYTYAELIVARAERKRE